MTFGLLPVMTTHQLIHLSTTVSFMATTSSDYELNTLHQSQADIDSHIRQFWDDFPCPPPWRPSILTEVNISKLGPQIGQSVKKFLVGKCQLQSFQLDPEWSEGDFDIPNSAGDGDSHATSTSHDHSWCDQACQLAIGCSGVFVAIVIILIAIICFNRSRRSHKMPSTRPSRQQLQMSTSTSDPVNWAEFSNTQVQFDDDIIYPPFRHRNLPSPPSQCHHPSCDPKWTCSNGSSFHPLMRVSPASTTYCTRGYTAVYEKIDDEDDEYYDDRVPCNFTRSYRPGERTMNIPPMGYRPSNGVPFIPESHANAARYREDETGFNGDNYPVSILPRYFELQDTHHSPNTSISTHEEQINVANNINRDNDSPMSPRTTNNKSYCNSYPLHNTQFFNNGNNGCNQLCATCISNVCTNSPPPCLNNHGQHEPHISNVNSLNSMNPIASTANGISLPAHISGYIPPNTSSFLQFSQTSDPPPPFSESVAGNNNPPPYTDQGCDLRFRNSSAKTLDPDPLYENENNDGRSPFTELTGTQPIKNATGSHSRACHMTQNTSPIGSPCRSWCPACQQVPLLNDNSCSDDSHSACSPWSKTYKNKLSQPSKISRSHSSDGNPPASDKDTDNVENRLVALGEEEVVNTNFNDHLNYPHRRKHDSQGRNGEVNTDNDCEVHNRHVQNDDCQSQGQENGLCNEDSNKQTLSLHSYYFNKQS